MLFRMWESNDINIDTGFCGREGDEMPEQIEKKQFIFLLSQTFLLKGVSENWISFLLEQGEWVVFQKKDKIYDRNQYRKSIGIILDGSVAILKGLDKKPVLFNVLHKGEIFGGAALFHEESNFIAEIYAKERCTILFLSQELLSRIFQKENRIAENYIRFLSNSLLYLNRKIDGFTAKDAEHTLSQYLLSRVFLEEKQELDLEYNLSQLAEYLNISRASLYRSIKVLSQKKVIQKEKKKIKVLDLDKLRSL